MLEVAGNIWDYIPEGSSTTDNILRCIPTNGQTKKNNELIMGKGLALEAKKMFPYLPKIFGEHVIENGNTVCIIKEIEYKNKTYSLASFPTKNEFYREASIELIEHSAIQLSELIKDWDYILLPRVGCGLGNLKWEEVRNVLKRHLRYSMFLIVNKEE